MFHARSRIVMEEVWKRGDVLVRLIFADAYTTVRQIRNCLLGGFSQEVQRWFLPEDTASPLAAIAPAAFRGGTLLGRAALFRHLARRWSFARAGELISPLAQSSSRPHFVTWPGSFARAGGQAGPTRRGNAAPCMTID